MLDTEGMARMGRVYSPNNTAVERMPTLINVIRLVLPKKWTREMKLPRVRLAWCA